MYFRCDSGIGVQLQASYELLVVEVGMSCQPLQLVQVNNCELVPPREGDKWFMTVVEEAGYRGDEIDRVNRVRCHQQVLFVSCVLEAGGRHIGPKYLEARPLEEKWSTAKFPSENPTYAALAGGFGTDCP